MKKLLTVLAVLVTVMSLSASGNAQAVYDTSAFTISALIKPSDYTAWPDSVGAWRVYGEYDLDKDGKKEFLVIVDPATTGGDTSMPTILRFEANGNDTYDLVWSTQINRPRSGTYSWPCLTVSDLDKDGNQEIIFGLPVNGAVGPNINPEVIYIWEYNTDSSNFLQEPTMTSNLNLPDRFYYAITSIVADDVDKDGDIELIISARRAYGGGSGTASTRPLMIYHLLGDVSPGFSSFEREFIDSIGTFNGGYYFNNHVVDFDGDGLKEIWGYTWDMIAFAAYEATGKDTYVLRLDVNQAMSPVDYGEQNSVAFYDANKDGKPEMFLAGQTSPPSAVFYLPNTNDLSTVSASSLKMLTSPLELNFQGATIGDIEGDGEVDFFIGDWSDARKVYRLSHIPGQVYDDSVGYTFDTLYSAPFDSTYTFPNVLFTNDLDGDGKRELIIVNTKTRAGFPNDASLIILESKVAVLGVRQISSLAPAAFSLDQNFPNPFNPTSTIRFSLANDGHVELFITNSLGQRVGSLVNTRLTAGTHEVNFTADGLSSGTYFYTLKAGNALETKKMTLVK